MENQQARDELIAELKRHGLPPAYIQRLLEELDDHLADMEEERSRKMNGARKPESTNTEVQNTNVISLHQRLGDPAQLAAMAAKQYHNRSFLGRHPILTFLLMPLPLILAGIFVDALAFSLIDFFFGDWLVRVSHSSPQIAYVLFIPFTLVISLLLPLGTMLLLCRVARNNILKWRWPIIGCLLVAIYSGELSIAWSLPLSSAGRVQVGFGFGFPPFCFPTLHMYLVNFLPKFIVALGVGILLIKRAQRLQKIDAGRQEINTSLRRAA